MTDRTLYEVDAEPDIADWLIETQVLVKVEPCAHGNYAPHDVPSESLAGVAECDGTPEADDGVHWGNTSGKPEAE